MIIDTTIGPTKINAGEYRVDHINSIQKQPKVLEKVSYTGTNNMEEQRADFKSKPLTSDMLASNEEALAKSIPYDDSVYYPSRLVADKSQYRFHIDAKQVIRVHYTNEILDQLLVVKAHLGTSQADHEAQVLFNEMRAFLDAAPADPFLEVVMAVHDALVGNKAWKKVSPQQLDIIYDLIVSLASNRHIDDSHINRALDKLMKLGFAIFPYSVETLDFDHASSRISQEVDTTV